MKLVLFACLVLTAWCAARSVLADDLHIEKRTLEDVFLELTGRELRS